jgi:UDP-glucose 4-epimerase
VTRLAWVVGPSGLLGKSLVAEVRNRTDWELFDSPSLPWNSSDRVETEIDELSGRFFASAAGREWTILWAAGAGVIATTEEKLEAEVDLFGRVLDGLGAQLKSNGLADSGSFFLASSAGGVYAGATAPPFTEKTDVAPLAPYGRAKLKMEAALATFAEHTRVATLVGRIANLYGPGQNLAKPQGVISALALAQLSPTPASIFVSLDTMRDYLYADDCASLVCDGIERLSIERVGGDHVVKVLASGVTVSIGALLGVFRQLARRHPNVAMGASPLAAMQVLDLRLRSVVWPELDRRELTPLAVGIRSILTEIALKKQQSS